MVLEGTFAVPTVRAYLALKDFRLLWKELDRTLNHDGAARILEQKHDSPTSAWKKPHNLFLEMLKISYG